MSRNSLNSSLITVLLASTIVLILVFTAAYVSSRSAENQIEGTPTKPAKLSAAPTSGPTPVPDTAAPVVTVKKVVASINEEIEAEMFIDTIEDVSECTVAFAEQPDWNKYGLQPVRLLVTDAAGNSTTVESELNIRNIKSKIELHLGEGVPAAEAFLAAEGSKISYVTDVSEIDTAQEGEYTIEVLVDGEITEVFLSVKDLKAPEVSLKETETWLNKPLLPEDFVEEVKDDTETGIVFLSEPDWSVEGEQTVTLTVSDVAGNQTTQSTVLRVKRDTKPPTLTVTDIDVEVGGTVAYKKAINYYDDIYENSEMTVEIERSEVDLRSVGTYTVTYRVTDGSGNTTTITGKVNVMEEAPRWADEDAIHTKADSILADILTENMTDRQKARAIYDWIKSHIGYISHSEKGNYMRGAYEGLFNRQGDCFVYAASAKELLTRAGLQNIDVVKAATNPSHYWNLVYVEDGWYHFDSTPRKDKSQFFLLTDAELEEYSSTHNNTHIFDRSLYPEIQ